MIGRVCTDASDKSLRKYCRTSISLAKTRSRNKIQKEKRKSGRASKSSLLEKVIVDRGGEKKRERGKKENGKYVDKQVNNKKKNNNKTGRKKGTMKISKQLVLIAKKQIETTRGEKSYVVFSCDYLNR